MDENNETFYDSMLYNSERLIFVIIFTNYYKDL